MVGIPGAIVERYAPRLASVVDLQRGDLAVLRRSDLDVGVMVAAVRGVEIVLGAIFEEFHRPAKLLRQPQHQWHVEVEEDLGAEPAADIRGDDPNLLLGNAEHEGCDDAAYGHAALARWPRACTRSVPGS